MSVTVKLLQAVCEAAGLDVNRVLSLEAHPGRVRFTVCSVDPVGKGMYLRKGSDEVSTYWVESAVTR